MPPPRRPLAAPKRAATPPDSTPPPFLLIGEVLRPHGVRGELKVRLLTRHPEHLAALKTVYLDRDPASTTPIAYTLKAMRPHQDYGLLTFKGIDDRNAAERLREHYVLVALADAVPLADDEAYLYQLIGIELYTEDGARFGTLTEVMETGANDVYIIDSEQHGEVLLPAIDSVILQVDMEAQRMTVHIPEGLLGPATPDTDIS
jgi:16S rRNA processing protein RimM